MDENNNNQVNYGPDPIDNGAQNYGPDPVDSGINPNQQPPVYENVNPESGNGSKGLAIGALVSGVLALVTLCCGFFVPGVSCLSGILSIVAIALGAIGMKKGAGKGMAIGGLVCGIIGLIVTIVLVIIAIIAIANGALEY